MFVKFYENCEIFMTGGSGVIGKAAIEKLLRSCNVKKIYILLRCKRGVSTESRLADIKNSKIFNVLKQCKPNELDKLVAISGNIEKDGLDISPGDLNVVRNVSVFINSAACTRFDEPLKSAIRLNIKSTFEALKLAEQMKNLKIFLHVSTFFSNPYLKFIEDKVYPAVFDWRTALKIMDLDDGDPTLDIITKKIITGFPNTYLFTKHLAETLVDDHRTKIPVAIYKPSIVITACVEPEPGFTETMTGIMGMMVIWGTGLLQAFYVKDLKMRIDMTPLDLGTKTLLMFTALRAQLPREKFIEATPVGKFSSIAAINTPLSDYCNNLTRAVNKYPLEKSFWIPNVTVTTCPFIYWILVMCLQVIPSILVDIILRICRIEPFMMKLQRKIYVTRKVLLFFLEKQYDSDGLTDMDEMLEKAHGTEFSVSIINGFIHSKELTDENLDNIAKGCRKYILNEPDTSIEKCRKILKAKIIVYNVLRGLVCFFIGRAIFQRLASVLDKKYS